MRVELLYFTGCPSWQVAADRLAEALSAEGRTEVLVERRVIDTPEQAEELRFPGSPTIRVDGVDPFATGEVEVGLTCRVYATPAGLRGCPEVAQLREVVR